MKKVLIIIGIVVAITIVSLVIILNTPNRIIHYLTVNTYYSYVYKEGRKIEIPIYCNDEDPLITNKDSHSSIFLESKDKRKKIPIDFVGVRKNNAESYLNEEYYELVFMFNMPNLSANLHIEDCYLNIKLINNDEYSFKIGNLCLLYYDNVGIENDIKITKLSGQKEENSYLSRLKTIVITGKMDDVIITEVTCGYNINLTFERINEDIIITVPNGKLLLNNIPLIIRYQKDGIINRQIIDNFVYFKDFEVLNFNEELINVY